MSSKGNGGDLVGPLLVVAVIVYGLSHSAIGLTSFSTPGRPAGKASTASAYSLARGAGFDVGDAQTMAAIATAESGLCTTAVGDLSLESNVWGPSVSLWQVRTLKADTGNGSARDVRNVINPVANARAARAIYLAQGFGAWSTYDNGDFAAFLGKPSATHSRCPTTGLGGTS